MSAPAPVPRAVVGLGLDTDASWLVLDTAAPALPWPAGRRLLRVADAGLLAAVLVVPVALAVLQA